MFARCEYRPARSVLVVVLMAVLGSVGCGKYGTISGKVYYQQKLLKGGNVYFHSPDGTTGSAPITEDGTYTVSKVSVGEATVCVETESIKPNPNAGRNLPPANVMMSNKEQGFVPPNYEGGKADRYVPIDKKYNDKEKSGVKYTVKSGKQEYNIELP